MLIFIFSASAVYSSDVRLRAEQKIITINMQNSKFKDILNEIREQSGLNFVYDENDVSSNVRKSINVKNESVIKVLDELLKGTNLEYVITNNSIIISNKKQIDPPLKIVDKKKEDPIEVKGRILSEQTGEPIVGATVIVVESPTNGTITNNEGFFVIKLDKGNNIEISSQGFVQQVVCVNSEKQLVISLENDVIDVDEVVVTGMNRRLKESFTGSYTTVNIEELKQMHPTDLLKALAFFDPSLNIIENNSRGSDPNAMKQMEIRGGSSLEYTSENEVLSQIETDIENMSMMLDSYSALPNAPLFILDGFIVPLQRIVDLDIERVGSVTILKDAAATAIYGSRASNGVIVFETKETPEGRLFVSYATNITVSAPDLTDSNLLNAREKLDLEWNVGMYLTVPTMNTYNKYKKDVLAGVDTYWLSQPLRTAVNQTHSLSLSGGTEAYNYSLSANFNTVPGVMKGSSRSSKSISFSMNYQHEKITLGANVNVSDAVGNDTPYGSFADYSRLNQYYRMYNNEGEYSEELDYKLLVPGISRVTLFNPLYNTQFKQKNETRNLTLSNNFNVEYAMLENLRFSGSASYNRGVASTDRFKSAAHTDFKYSSEMEKGTYNKTSGSSENWNLSFSSNYNLVVDKHLLSIFANATLDESKSEMVVLSASGFPNDNMDDLLFARELDRNVNGSESTSRSFGATGQISYMYDGRYAVDFSVRGDISSRFGENGRFAPFWSTGVRYNAHDEEWVPEFFNDLTLRASYGRTGSQNFEPYQAMELYTFSNMMVPYEGFNTLGAKLMGIHNPNLGWSTTNETSAGIDMGFLKNRISVGASVYKNVTNELLVDFTLAPSSGFAQMVYNVGSVKNEGFEFSLSGVPYRNMKKRIQWVVSVNGSTARDEILNISNSLEKMNEEALQTQGAPLPVYIEGYSRSEQFMVRSLGINPINGREVFLTRDNEMTYNWSPADKVPVGTATPKIRGNITSSLNIGDFNMSLGMSYQLGAMNYNSTLLDKVENVNLAYNVDRRAATERWDTLGEASYFKGYSYIGNYTQATTRFLMKLNEFRLSSISIGYRFTPEKFKFLDKLRMSALNINCSTNDLLRLASVAEERGIDYPFTRSFNISLNVTF